MSTEPATTVGLVLVHGIGEQARGDTLQKFLTGFGRSFPSVAVELDPQRPDRATLRDGHRTIRVYEAWWASHLSGESVAESFREDALLEVVWFPLLNRRAGVYAAGEYAPWLVRAWSVALLPSALLLNLMLLGARTAGRLLDPAAYRHRAALEAAAVVERPAGGSLSTRAVGAWRDAQARAVAGRGTRSRVDWVLDNVAADVTNYVNAAAGAAPGESATGDVARHIDDVFRNTVAEAAADGCDQIQVLAHSLGTLVAYRCLAADGARVAHADAPDAPAAPVITRLLTIGSPLEKIRFIWPSILERNAPAPAVLARGETLAARGADDMDWHNFTGLFDPVSGTLRRFDLWGPVHNHRTPGLGGLATSHVAYESSPVFMDVLGHGLLGRPAERRPGRWHVLTRGVLASLENLAMPAALVLLILAGAAAAYLTGWAGGFIIGLPLRLYSADAAATLRHGFGLFALVAMTTFALPAAHARARQLHARFFAA